MDSRTIDITGQRFGRLVVRRYVGTTGHGALWECICDCGTVHHARGVHLRHGSTRSCGCAQHATTRGRALVPADTVQRAKELYLAGYTVREVADALHYTSDTAICKMLWRAGVSMRTAGQRPRASSAQLWRAYQELKSPVAVARRFGLSHSTVSTRLKRYRAKYPKLQQEEAQS